MKLHCSEIYSNDQLTDYRLMEKSRNLLSFQYSEEKLVFLLCERQHVAGRAGNVCGHTKEQSAEFFRCVLCTAVSASYTFIHSVLYTECCE